MPGKGNLGAWICSVLCTGWAALATVALLYPGFGTSDPDAALPEGFEPARGAFETSQFVPLAALVGIGLLLYASGARTRSQRVELPLVDETKVAPRRCRKTHRNPTQADRKAVCQAAWQAACQAAGPGVASGA